MEKAFSKEQEITRIQKPDEMVTFGKNIDEKLVQLRNERRHSKFCKVQYHEFLEKPEKEVLDEMNYDAEFEKFRETCSDHSYADLDSYK